LTQIYAISISRLAFDIHILRLRFLLAGFKKASH
jgi:hypothetical protein